jgi:hypothetical protein
VVLQRDGNSVRVEIRGVDVFRPQTGEISSVGPDGIACWFVDTDAYAWAPAAASRPTRRGMHASSRATGRLWCDTRLGVRP